MPRTTNKQLALLCERAYAEHTYEAGGVEVLHSGNILAFRGTTFDGADILKDLRGYPWYDKRLGWCHKGFLRGAQAIWPILRDVLWDLPPQWLTGHSKGGAEATLIAALMIADKGMRSPAGLVTFGSPRVGRKKLIKIVRAIPMSLRYVNGNDPVPSHPWEIWGYDHVPGILRLKGGNDWDMHDHRIADYIGNV